MCLIHAFHNISAQMINTLKMAQRLYTGSLSMPMLKLGSGFGLIAVCMYSGFARARFRGTAC